MGRPAHVGVRARSGAALALGGVLLALVLAPPAHAACHAFDVSVQPSTPGEGQTVQVVVRRDGAVAPSSVRVRTVDQTARAGQDYAAVDRRIGFTGDSVQESFALQTREDVKDEPAETFRIELSQGQGCAINQRFTYGTATVSISDDDEPATTTSASTTVTTTPATSPPSTAEDTTTSTTEPDAETTTTAPTIDGEALADEGDDGSNAGVVVLAVALVLVVLGAVGWRLRPSRR